MSEPLLSVENLTVERGGRIVLSNLSFALCAGEAILVSGRNGAGKSTLLRTICGLLPERAGHIGYGLADDEVRGVETVHYLGYEDALKPSLTVGENLTFWAAMLSAPSPVQGGSGTMRGMVEGAAFKEIATAETVGHMPPPPPTAVPFPRVAGEDASPRDALAAFGMARLIDLPAAYLSAGQKRRVALARLLVADRPLWLLDEPLIALDANAQATLIDIMAGHIAAGGGILVASHQPIPLPCREIDLGAQAVA